MNRLRDDSSPPAGYPKLAPGMKPGDHPDFYRLPPPKGRTRESKIVLDEHGYFYNEGVRVDHAGMARAFASWIRRHPEDGRYVLDNRYDWTYFTVADVPFFVRSAAVDEGESACHLELSDGSVEVLDPASLTVGGGDALYTRVKGGDFEAKFTPRAQAALLPLVVEAADGSPAIQVAGQVFRVLPRQK